MVRLKRNTRCTIDIFFILALITLFAITSFFVVIIGARQYHSIAGQMTMNYETRTAASYLTEKFNQNDVKGSIAITDVNEIPAIALTQTIQEQEYTTYIYVYDGYLREITVSRDTVITPESGQKVIEAAALDIQACSNHLYRFIITDTTGNSCPIYISWNAK